MRKAVKLELSEAEKEVLAQRLRTHPSPAVRNRCQLIILKSGGRTAEDIATITGMCVISVHSWVRRYRQEGIDGLLTKPGRGRKKKLTVAKDAPVVTQSIAQHRQSLKAAKAAYEGHAGSQQVSEETFRSFLKVLTTDIKESESGWVKHRTRITMTTK